MTQFIILEDLPGQRDFRAGTIIDDTNPALGLNQLAGLALVVFTGTAAEINALAAFNAQRAIQGDRAGSLSSYYAAEGLLPPQEGIPTTSGQLGGDIYPRIGASAQASTAASPNMQGGIYLNPKAFIANNVFLNGTLVGTDTIRLGIYQARGGSEAPDATWNLLADVATTGITGAGITFQLLLVPTLIAAGAVAVMVGGAGIPPSFSSYVDPALDLWNADLGAGTIPSTFTTVIPQASALPETVVPSTDFTASTADVAPLIRFT